MKIVGLGDSITWGYPEGPEYSWLRMVGEKLSCEVVNRGTNGAVLSYMRTRIPQVVEDQADLVIVMGGTNDAFDKLSVERVGNEFKAIVEELKEKTNAIIVIGLPIPLNYNEQKHYLNGYRDWMREFAAKEQYPVIDFYSALVDEQTGEMPEIYNLDDLHTNEAGNARMAEAAYKVLKELQ